MNKAEAAETILGGESERVCTTCNGRRVTVVVHDELTTCGACKGLGALFDEKYEEACKFLGLETPREVWTRKLARQWAKSLNFMGSYTMSKESITRMRGSEKAVQNFSLRDYARRDAEATQKMLNDYHMHSILGCDDDKS